MPNHAFTSILFPVDFSPMNNVTAPYVRDLAVATGASVTLLHVVPWLSGWYGAAELRPAVGGDQTLQDLHNRQMLALEMFRERYFSHLRCFRLVKEGAVAETIVDTARQIQSDLIMMPTRGLGSSRRFLIGSTTAKVLHDAQCAVWTTPHLDPLRRFTGFRHMLCAVDRNEVPPDFLKEMVRLARCFESKLSFVTAIPSVIGGMGEERKIRSLDEEFPQAHLRDHIGCDLDCKVYLETGSIADVVRHLVEKEAVDLVVIHRGHLQHPFGKLRTHTYEIVLESPCPVLSLYVTAQHPLETAEYASLQTA